MDKVNILGVHVDMVNISQATDSVSYTHLRAHETDSYLVCRLLLEKKKQATDRKLVCLLIGTNNACAGKASI